ncbi:UNVERIFIED_CONTAM: hypothetical protein K2H54_063918, partial [Gekko kuhli]
RLPFLKPDSISRVEEAGDLLFQDREERRRSAEVEGPQNKSKGEPQQFLLEEERQGRNTGTKWKRGNECFSSQGAESEVQEVITQQRYPGATFPGGEMKPVLGSLPSVCVKAASVKPEQ